MLCAGLIDGFRPRFSALYKYVERDFENSTAVSGNLFLRHVLAQTLYPLLRLGREILPEIGSLKERTNLYFGFSRHGIRAALQPFHGLFHGPHLPYPITSDQFFGLGERTIDHRSLGSRKPD